ncbi:MAG: DUF2125 domain-containing protein [Stellaceae bacterium]
MKATRYLVISLVVLLLAAGGYTAYWFVTARSLEAGLNKWAEQRRAQGYELVWGNETVSGFPLAFRIALSDAAIARGNSYRVAVPEVVGTASPLDLSRWRIVAAHGGTGRAQGIDADVAAQGLGGAVTLGADASVLDVAARNVSGAGATAGEIAGHFTLPRHAPTSHRDLGLAASVQVYHLTLPKAVKALGNTIETVAADLAVMGGLPAGDWRHALAAWRDDGGTVELRRGNLQWGALRLEANGTFALDGDMQPTAALHASIVDHGALVDAAVGAGMLQKKNALLVKLVLDLIAKDGPDGQRRLTAPVTLQDGKLAIGRAEIGKVPPIDWK